MKEYMRQMARKSGGHFASGSRYSGQQGERDAYFQGLSEMFDFSGEEHALEVSFMFQQAFGCSFAVTKRIPAAGRRLARLHVTYSRRAVENITRSHTVASR